MTNPENGLVQSQNTEQKNQVQQNITNQEQMINDLVAKSTREDKDHSRTMAGELSQYLNKTYPGLSLDQKKEALTHIFGDVTAEYMEKIDHIDTLKLGVTKDMVGNIGNQLLDEDSSLYSLNTEEGRIKGEAGTKEEKKKQKETNEEYDSIRKTEFNTRILRTTELTNPTVKKSFDTYNADLNTANPNVLSNISGSLSKGQATKIENADVSQMLFFRRIVKDNPQSTDIPQNIRKQFADKDFTKTFDKLTSDFSVPKIDITNPYLSSQVSKMPISGLADSQIADTIAKSPTVTKVANDSLNMPARPENGDMRDFNSQEMADKLGIKKSLNIPTQLSDMSEPLQYTNILDDMMAKNNFLVRKVSDNNGKIHHVVDTETLKQEYGETAPLIAQALMAYAEMKDHPNSLANATPDIQEKFIGAIKRGTDEIMLHMSEIMTKSLTAQTSEAYLQSIADSFTKSPDTQFVSPPTYNEDGQLVLTLKEDNNLNNNNTDTTYQLIFHPDGRVERTNVALVMDDSDHPVDFVRKGTSTIASNFPSVTDMIKKNADALSSTSIYDGIRGNDEPMSVLINQQMRESITKNNDTVDVQLAMTQAELSHATLQGQVYENAITCFLTAHAADKNISVKQDPLYHKLLSPNGQENLGTGELGKFVEVLTAMRNTTDNMSSDEMIVFNDSLRSFIDLQNQPIEYTSQYKDPLLSSFVHKGEEGKKRTLPISSEGVQLADSGMDIVNMLIYNDGDDQCPKIDTTFFSAMNSYASTDQAKNISFDQSPEGKQRLTERSGNLGKVKTGFEDIYSAYHGEGEGADVVLTQLQEPDFNMTENTDGSYISVNDNSPDQRNLDLPRKPFILYMTNKIKNKENLDKQNTQNSIALARQKFDKSPLPQPLEQPTAYA